MPPARLPVPRGSTIVIENEKAKKTIMVHFYKISIIYRTKNTSTTVPDVQYVGRTTEFTTKYKTF